MLPLYGCGLFTSPCLFAFVQALGLSIFAAADAAAESSHGWQQAFVHTVPT